jgi:predicted negative regulator of RcsB-dependent stress response
MKKKEKEHLKADPFAHFIQQTLSFLKGHRRSFLLGAAAVALVVLVLLAVLLLSGARASGENARYAEAFRVRNDATLGTDEKIAALGKMTFGRGISASGHLFLAALHYEKGDLAGAEAALRAMPRSRMALLNDEKLALHAQLLAALGRGAEAEAELGRLLAGKKTALARELILLQLAKLQRKGRRGAEADATLKRIVAEHAGTAAASEAQGLLAAMENESQAAR